MFGMLPPFRCKLGVRAQACASIAFFSTCFRSTPVRVSTTSPPKEQQRWDGPNAISFDERAVVIRIDLAHEHTLREVAGNVSEQPRHLLARHAPLGPEIDDRQPGALQHLALEIAFVEVGKRAARHAVSAVCSDRVPTQYRKRVGRVNFGSPHQVHGFAACGAAPEKSRPSAVFR